MESNLRTCTIAARPSAADPGHCGPRCFCNTAILSERKGSAPSRSQGRYC